jgi:hypothetical protein
MIIHQASGLSMYFAQAGDCPVSHMSAGFEEYCKSLVTQFGLAGIALLRQIHGVEGYIIDEALVARAPLQLFEQQGDFIVTSVKHYALAIKTADCLPIILFDQKTPSLAVIHAGWKGSVGNIVKSAIDLMVAHYGADVTTMQAYFGPSARECCYEVDDLFINNLAPLGLTSEQLEQIFFMRDSKIFFSTPRLNMLLLKQCGVDESNIFREHNQCTIEHIAYHSYRRDGENAGRQLTLAWLD